MTTSRKLSPARPCPFLTDNIIDPTIDCVPEVGVTQKAPMATSGTLCSVQACLFLTHKIIESAVKRVPTEVWQQIFCQTITDRSSFEITETDRGPWILCKVHPEWDAIASTVPDLWTRFTLFADATTVAEEERTRHLLTTVIDRSGSLSLEFTAEFTDDAAAEIVLPHLVQAMGRWRDVSIEASHLTFQFLATYVRLTLDFIGHSASEAMGRLEDIDLTTSPIRGNPALRWDCYNIFDSALNLRSIYLGGIWVRNMPWGRLNDACVDGQIARVDVMELLRAGSALRELTMPNEFTLPQIVPPTVVHHSLQILRVCDPALLGFLEAPSLITLEFIDCIFGDPNNDEFEIITRFLPHSPNLQSMAITVYWMDVDRICTGLSALLPQLRELEITVHADCDDEDGNSLFDNLTDYTLPRLERLTIYGEVIFCAESLLYMLVKRTESGWGLHHVELHCAQFIVSEDERQRLRDMKAHGLGLEIFGKLILLLFLRRSSLHYSVEGEDVVMS